jgi:hypothetical protein
MKLKFNKKYLLLILAVFLVLVATGIYFFNIIKKDKSNPSSFKGVIKTGEQLGNFKNYCPEGLYLVTDDGSYMADQVKFLQLRVPDVESNTKMFDNKSFVDQQVEVVGKYPAQEMFCQALMCDCDDYILIDSEKSITPY